MSLRNLQEELRLLDEKIVEADEHARGLRSQRNSLLPICQLPNEVLSLIFLSCVTKPTSPVHYLSYIKRPLPEWLAVTQVCRHWRAVALSCTAMWTAPDFRIPSLAREMLLRAKAAPLQIHAYMSNRFPKHEALREALQHMDRIEELHITASQLRDLFADLERPAPMLCSLAISNTGDEPFTLPESMLASDVVRLRHLKLEHCSLNWETMTLRSLTSLTLYGDPRTAQPFLQDFLHALKRMQALQRLKLVDYFPSGESVNLEMPGVILPQLKYVSMRSPLPTCVALLDAITPPSTAEVDITATVSGAHEYNLALPCLSQLTRIIDEHVRAVFIDTTRDSLVFNRFVLKVFERADIDALSTLDQSGISFQIVDNIESLYRVSDAEVDVLARQMFEMLPLSHLQTLHLGMNHIQANDYVRHFGSLAELDTIHLQGPCASSFLDAFGQTLPSHIPTAGSSCQPPQRNEIAFSGLKTLTFESVDFGDTMLHWSSPFIDELFAQLQYRSERGMPIQKLTVWEGVNFSRLERKKLEPVVGEVDWDGIVDCDSETDDDDDDDD